MLCSNNQSCHIQVQVCRTITTTDFYGLLAVVVSSLALFLRICIAEHVDVASPSQRNAYENAPVAVAPANVGRSFLMRNKTQIGCRDCVSKSRKSIGKVEDTGNHLACIVAENAIVNHHVLAILRKHHVDVQTATSLAYCNLRSKAQVYTIVAAEFAENPLCDNQLFYSRFSLTRKEFYFLLLVVEIAISEVPDLGVSVLNLTATLSNKVHCFLADELVVCKRSRLVVTALVNSWEHSVFALVGNDVVFEFAQSLESVACCIFQLLVSLLQDVFGRRSQWLAVVVVVRAKDVDARNFLERIYESSAVLWNYIQVARTCTDKSEQAGTVNALASGKNLVEVFCAVDDEVQGLEPTVATNIAEVEHLNVVFYNIFNDVSLCELLTRLLQKPFKKVWT